MSNLTKGLILVVAILLIGAGLVVWKNKVGHAQSFNSISKSEINLLLADVAKTNPSVLKRLKEDPEMKEQQVKNLKQLLAFASEAQREGLANEPAVKEELENIRQEVLAVSYDKEINKDKGPMPPFGFISEEQVQQFWQSGVPAAPQGFLDRIGLGGSKDTRAPEQQFEDFLNAKVEMMKRGAPEGSEPPEITEEQRTQARDVFAKIRLYKSEFDQKAAAGELDKAFIEKTNLQVKLQQAQFLARLYADKATEQTKVTDEEVDAYIKQHPEYDPATKRAKAEEILARAKAGEDFAALANEFSQDPGNKKPDGTMNGGLYADVPKGRMVAPFEAAALAQEQGGIAPEIVESDFGYHIIKLERKLGPSPNKGKEKNVPPIEGDTYDVRHILISTGIKDEKNPMAREVPVKDFVRNKLEEEKENKLLEEIVARNNVSVAEDWDIPEVTDQQLQQMRQQNMPQMPPPSDVDDGAGPPAGAPQPEANKQ